MVVTYKLVAVKLPVLSTVQKLKSCFLVVVLSCYYVSFMLVTYCGIRSKTSRHTSEESLEQSCTGSCISPQGLELTHTH